MMLARYAASFAVGYGTGAYAITGARWAVIVVFVGLYVRLMLIREHS